MLYLILKWIHILAAVTALGANITYSIWRSRAAQKSENLGFALHTINFIDMRLANPAYTALFVLGAFMVYLGHWPLTSPWLIVAVILYIDVFLLGFLVIAPISRKQLALVETTSPDSAEYRLIARRANIIGVILVAVVVAILFLMVVKPALWSSLS